MIKDFPSYGWICKLSKDRVFSGSIGTHGEKGFFVVSVFHYKIWREDNTLHASCYVRTPDGEITGQDAMECELSPENIDIVQNWLEEQMNLSTTRSDAKLEK